MGPSRRISSFHRWVSAEKACRKGVNFSREKPHGLLARVTASGRPTPHKRLSRRARLRRRVSIAAGSLGCQSWCVDGVRVGWVGVGDRGRAAGYPAPPAQIRTCTASASGSCIELEREALVWIGMDDFARRDPTFDPACELFPGHIVSLTAPPEHPQPHPVDFSTHCVQCAQVPRNSVILEVAPNLAA